MEWETESIRQVGGWGGAQWGVKGEIGSRTVVVDRCQGQETFACSVVHCGRSSKGWGVRV